MKKIAVLGATGSVGSQTVEVARYLKDNVDIVCISADSNWEGAVRIAHEFSPDFIVMGNDISAEKVRNNIDYDATVFSGFCNAVKAVEESGCDFVVLATAGIDGISVFEYCLKNGISVGLANKESVVCGGHVINEMMHSSAAKVYPIDSEHSAIYQCLKNSYDTSGVRRILLTASGGPFFGRDREFLKNVTADMALKHPNWSMGKKITIDSATLANKGQEVIEARYLFNIPASKIKVVVHPQSLVHSMVEFVDGCIMAQIGPIDMRLPIQRVLTEDVPYKNGLWDHLDITHLPALNFFEANEKIFRCLKLAYDALDEGGAMTAVYSISDEAAVELFLRGNIGFLDIPDIIEKAMDEFSGIDCKSVEEILHINSSVREKLFRQYFN